MAGPLVLCYHAVSDTWEDVLAVRPRDLERQLELLVGRGFRPVPASAVVAGRGRLLHVTFDDAYASVANALPALERLGVQATVLACTGYAADGRPLAVPELAAEAAAHPEELATTTWDGLRALVERGVEVGSHTVSHPRLTELDAGRLERELRESRERLEDELGRPCRFLAYPYGDEDARVRLAARRAGYAAAFSLPGRAGDRDPFGVPRVAVWRADGDVRVRLKASALARRAAAALRRVRPAPSPRSQHV